MKTYHRILALAALSIGATAYSAPMMALGDNAELFLTASANLRSDDNISLKTNNELSDVVWNFVPGLDLVYGRNAETSGHIYFREEFLKYSDNSDLDTNLADVGITSVYNNGKTKVDAAASYRQTAQNDPTIPGAIVDRDVTNLKAATEFGASEKTTVGVGALYDKTNYGPAGYTDSSIWNLPLDAYFEYSPKLAWSVGYRYRSTDLGGSAIDSQDHFFNIGARGEFSPKLTGQIRLGYSKRSFDRGSDANLFGVDSTFSYAFSEKTTYQLGLSNDFGSAASGQSTKNRTINVAAISKIDEQWGWNVGLNFRSIDYPTRTDDYLEGVAGVSYTYSNNLNFAASYTYRNNSSDSAAFEFTNNVFSIGANIRY